MPVLSFQTLINIAEPFCIGIAAYSAFQNCAHQAEMPVSHSCKSEMVWYLWNPTGSSIRMVPNCVSDLLSMLSSRHALKDDDPIDNVSSLFIMGDVCLRGPRNAVMWLRNQRCPCTSVTWGCTAGTCNLRSSSHTSIYPIQTGDIMPVSYLEE